MCKLNQDLTPNEAQDVMDANKNKESAIKVMNMLGSLTWRLHHVLATHEHVDRQTVINIKKRVDQIWNSCNFAFDPNSLPLPDEKVNSK